jgi:L-cysteate sulfo-lyase
MNYKNIPQISLGFFPTPVVELSNLRKKLGNSQNCPRIFMKRDDNTGLALGGNKTRKLEFILADALDKGADTIITAGATQSNHCRQTAAACASLNLECHLVLGGEEPSVATGNLLLDKLFGSIIHWAGENRKGEDIPRVCNQLEGNGKKTYVIPYGGSNELGVLSYVEALRELEVQLENREKPTHIFLASSSGGTHAGLILGKKILNASYDIIGICIDKLNSQATLVESILSLANRTAKLIKFDGQLTEKDVILNFNYTGEGYGIAGDLEKNAISLIAKTEGILLDPVYTARAMGGLIDLIQNKKFTSQDRILFWHTGGTPSLFT